MLVVVVVVQEQSEEMQEDIQDQEQHLAVRVAREVIQQT
jgi:hypothetical protein